MKAADQCQYLVALGAEATRRYGTIYMFFGIRGLEYSSFNNVYCAFHEKISLTRFLIFAESAVLDLIEDFINAYRMN